MKEEWIGNSVFATDSGINKDSGGGVVSCNISEAMAEVSNVKLICANINERETGLNGTTVKTINPQFYGYPPDPPFMKDYLTCSFIQDIKEPIDLFVTYACPFGMSAKYLRLLYGKFTKIITDIAPHNISLSREEHLKWGAEYPYPHLNDEMLFKLYTKHLRLADLVIVHSRLGKEYVTKTLSINSLVTCIPHGFYPFDVEEIDTSIVKPGYFGSCCGLDKGVVYLLQALEKTGIKGYFGGKDSKMMDKMFTFIQNKPYWDAIGPVDNLGDFYKYVNVGVFPSITEGFNICALECMSAGRPVIITPTVGMADYITDGKEGFIVESGNSDVIAKKLLWFKDNPQELQRMGKEACKTAERYKWSDVKEMYSKAFKEVL